MECAMRGEAKDEDNVPGLDSRLGATERSER